jgi:starvation-inducible DNA-binding protein
MMEINIGLKDSQRKPVIDILNALLGDEVVLYIKTRNYHWNVEGPDFSETHKFFEAQYEELDEIMDEVAERARALGGRAAGSLGEYLKLTRLTEDNGRTAGEKAMISDLLKDHEAIIRQLRADLESVSGKHGDMGTNDFLTGLMEQHEKMAWMLRSYLR